jgi:hypothetical protein
MKPASPPAFATWLLEHMVLGGQNEALTGDLLEEFQHRQSDAWYWRQVLGAILAGVLSELRTEWSSGGPAIVCTFGLATAWDCAVSKYWPPFPWIIARTLAAGAVRHHWLMLLLFVMEPYIQFGLYIADNAAMLGVGIVVYLLIGRSLRLSNFVRGLLVGLLVIALEDQAWRLIGHAQGLLLWHYISFFWFWFSWLPLFVAVLMALWTAGWPKARSRSERVLA